jgi:hypothetical protein
MAEEEAAAAPQVQGKHLNPNTHTGSHSLTRIAYVHFVPILPSCALPSLLLASVSSKIALKTNH